MMNWFKKKSNKIVKEDTVDSLMDEILSDPLVKVEMKLTPLGFRKTSINQDYNLYTSIQSLPISQRDRNKIHNIGYVCLKYDFFYLILYRFRGNNYAYGLSKDIGFVDISEIIDMSSTEIQKVLGNLYDSNLKEFTRNNIIDNLL